MKKKDFILICLVLIVVSISFGINTIINNKDSEAIEIYVDNKLYKTYSIDDEEEFKINTKDGYNIVKIHNGGVEITEASCPDKVCIKSGFITKSSESIVCLPNKVNIKIITHNKNKQKNEEDIIVN